MRRGRKRIDFSRLGRQSASSNHRVARLEGGVRNPALCILLLAQWDSTIPREWNVYIAMGLLVQ